jgi:glycosyltransferase involved in cell wall biosynthesis
MSDPKFSIVTVTLNPPLEDLLCTVNSVINQSFTDWELIIKDGGSSESTFLEIPVDPRIKIVHSRDSGIFDAMNQGIQLTKGGYICLLNAGDIFLNEYALESVANVCSGQNNIRFVYGDCKKLKSKLGYEFYPDKLSKFFLFSNMICHQCWFVHREQYLKNRLYETNFKIGSDYRYFLHMIFEDNANYIHIPKVLIQYKGDGVSQNPQLIAESQGWRDAARRKYYSNHLFVYYSCIVLATMFLKKIIYVGPIPTIYQRWRLSGRLQESSL